METEEVRVIGRYVPSGDSAAYVAEELDAAIRPLLGPCCKRERISIRIPHAAAPEPHPNNLEWHQDGGGPDGTTHHMIIWASEMPTELRKSDGTIVSLEPFDLVWFDNTVCWHRQPRGTDETRRWFIAVRCSGALS